MAQPYNGIRCVFSTDGAPPLRAYSDASGTYWFIARDVLESLGIIAAQSTLSRLGYRDKIAVGTDNPYGLHKHTVAISEQGLYELAITSRKPGAVALKARLFGHISPTLRALPHTAQRGTE